MKKYSVTLLLATMLVALSAGSASATPGQSFHTKLKGSFAEALWETTTANSFTDTYVVAEVDSPGGPFVSLDVFTGFSDGSSVETFGTAADASVTVNVSKKLDDASATASVPVTICTFDAIGNGGCVDDGSVAVDAHWTGVGSAQHGVFKTHITGKGFKLNDHFNGYQRDATATASVGADSLNASMLLFADLGTSKQGTSRRGPHC